jgi:hypothetical protein
MSVPTKMAFICEDCNGVQDGVLEGEEREDCIECGHGPMCRSCAEQHVCEEDEEED